MRGKTKYMADKRVSILIALNARCITVSGMRHKNTVINQINVMLLSWEA